MKILEIELKNLNSLRGRWRIDLSDNLYETNGIFAITGPTGAGKTTIFDAVCLALYGQTPRLVSINDKQNEIMSRRSDECYAKVIFESEGKKFISLWSQHKSGAKNKLQKQKHILSDAESGEIFSDKVSETPKIIQEITGLDFRRFKQAVMLEQGGFDAFLKADKNERAEILELLTGTKIYSEISKLVYIRAGQEQNELNNIKIQRDSLKPNDDFNDEDEILNAMSLAGKNLLSAENQQAEAKNAIDWLKNIQKLENDIAENQHEFEQHKKRVEIFTTDQRKLETGLKAAELLGDYSNLKAQRSNFKKISEHVEKIKNEIEQELEILSQTEEKEIPELESIYKKITKDVPENETPESLGARAKERAILFSGIAKEKQDTEIAKKEAEKKFQTAQAALTSAEKNYSQYQEEYAKAAKKFEELVSMRAEAIFDDARRNLQPGTPCPVCGATEHPSANFLEEKNFGDISKFDDALKIARQQTKTAHEKLNEAHKNYSAVKSIESSARTNLDNLISEFNKISERRSVSRLEIDELMKQMGISVKVVADIMPRINVWLQDVATLNEKIKRAKERREFLKNQIEANKKTLLSENSELENLSDELKKLESDFISALHEKNFENEKIFNAAKVDYDELKKLQNRKQELDGEKNRLQGVKDNLEQKLKAESEKAITSRNLAELLPEFKEREKLINTLKEKIFTLKKNLSDRQKLKSQLKELDEKYKAQEKISSNWNALNSLIGSAKGDKFRVFAQNITLGMMIDLANSQLEKMNGRYVLMARPESSGLELSVIDKEQAGEIRPTENLSGGERFIISLALALGLSKISGNKSRIDSLFLDEGFGSLDEDALNTALDALGELRRDGRMIGIISHVQALQERIAVQIHVIPKHEGVSIIEGAGVSLIQK